MMAMDTHRLRELIRAYYNLTHIRVAVYNTDFEEILAYPEEYTPFCSMLQSNEKACAQCEHSAARMCKTCTLTHETIVEQCHMGLTELVTPVYNGASIIGYIMLGQITDSPDLTAFQEQVFCKSEEYGLDRREVERLLGQVKYYSTEQVLSSAQVVKALASYIVVSNLLYPTETLMAQSIVEYISKNLAEDVGADALCREFSISKATLYRIMKPYAPRGIAAYVKELRISKACELLRHTEQTMSAVAEQVGYADTAYFLRSFKKEKGISAGAYRKNNI